MKYLLKSIAFAIVLFAFTNCAVEPVESQEEILATTAPVEDMTTTDDVNTCVGEAPKARLINNTNVDVEFTVYDADVNVVAQNLHIHTNQSSNWENLTVGELIFVVVSNISGDKIVVTDVDYCKNYEFVIDSNFNVTYTSTEL